MKRIFLFLLLLCIIGCNSNSNSNNNNKGDIAVKKEAAPTRFGWEEKWYEVYGDVESLTAEGYRYEYKYGYEQEPIKVYNGKAIYIFSPRGDVNEYFEYDEHNVLEEYFIFKYNGKIVEKSGFDKYDKEEYKITYQLDDERKIVEMHKQYGDNNETHTIFKYNGKDQLIEEIENNANGELLNRTIIEYNEHGDCIKNDTYDADGDMRGCYLAGKEYIYDDKGNLSKIVYESYYTEITYDDAGNVTKIEDYGVDTHKMGLLFHTIIYKYDKAGNMIERIDNWLNSNGKVVRSLRMEREYDEHGNIIVHRGYEGNGEIEILEKSSVITYKYRE